MNIITKEGTKEIKGNLNVLIILKIIYLNFII